MKTTQQKKQQKSQMVTGVTLAVFGVGMILAIFGLSQTVVNIDQETVSREPEAILASAGVENGADIGLPVAYFDQRSDECVNLYDTGNNALRERQFEWQSCGYNYSQIEQGLVEYELGEDYWPVAVGGKLLPNRGLKDMSRWFNSVEGKSKEYTGKINLAYKTNGTTEFAFINGEFYPLDEVEFSAGDSVNKDGHNHLFTMSFAVPFTVMASGDESLEITADDDTFVFVGRELVLDMGGVHEATKARLAIHENGEVYTAVDSGELAYSGIQVEKGQGSILRIFHADRDASESVFKLRLVGMNLNLVQTQIAGSNDGGVQVAYDPTDPSYVAPLGESSVFRPDGTKGYLIAATILSVVIVTCAMFTAILAHVLIKQKK